MAIRDFAVYKKIKNRILSAINDSIKEDMASRGKVIDELEEKNKQLALISDEKDEARNTAQKAFYKYAEKLFTPQYGFEKKLVDSRVVTCENPYSGATYSYNQEIYDLVLGDSVIVNHFESVDRSSKKSLHDGFTKQDVVKFLGEEKQRVAKQLKEIEEKLDSAKKDLENYKKRFFKTSKTERNLTATVETLTANKEMLVRKTQEINESISSYNKDKIVFHKLYDDMERKEKDAKASFDKVLEVHKQILEVSSLNDSGLMLVDDKYHVSKDRIIELVDENVTNEDIKTLKNDNFFVQNAMNEKRDDCRTRETSFDPKSRQFNQYLDSLLTNKIVEEMYNDVNSDIEEC